jgi:hypothetical protein
MNTARTLFGTSILLAGFLSPVRIILTPVYQTPLQIQLASTYVYPELPTDGTFLFNPAKITSIGNEVENSPILNN